MTCVVKILGHRFTWKQWVPHNVHVPCNMFVYFAIVWYEIKNNCMYFIYKILISLISDKMGLKKVVLFFFICLVTNFQNQLIL